LIQSHLRERYQKVLIDKINAYGSASSRWKKVTNGVPLGLISGPLLIPIYINDLPKTMDDTKVMLFADDTSIIATNSNQRRLKTALNKILSDIISWLEVNFLLLKFNKTYYLEYRTKTCIDATLDINYFNKSIGNSTYTKFLYFMIEDTLMWDNILTY
jgi:hypothetical protein